MRARRLVALIAVVVLAVSQGLWANPAQASQTDMVATLTAEEAQPMPGPVGATGTAALQADPELGRVCYQLEYNGPGDVTGAHIHRGEKGVTGPVTINLDVQAECVEPGPDEVQALVDWPDGYYIEFHTVAYQLSNGAVRGQVACVGEAATTDPACGAFPGGRDGR